MPVHCICFCTGSSTQKPLVRSDTSVAIRKCSQLSDIFLWSCWLWHRISKQDLVSDWLPLHAFNPTPLFIENVSLDETWTSTQRYQLITHSSVYWAGCTILWTVHVYKCGNSNFEFPSIIEVQYNTVMLNSFEYDNQRAHLNVHT